MISPPAARIRKWMYEPENCYREWFGLEPDPKQEEILKAFSVGNKDPRSKLIGQQAAVGVGKTHIKAALGLMFGGTRPNSKVPCISITADNLRDGLWAEMAMLRQKSRYLMAISKYSAESITFNANPAYWRIIAKSYAKSADKGQLSSALKGIHGDYVLFLIDEAGDMPPAVFETAYAAMSGGIETRIVISGNPTSLEGALYHVCVELAGKAHVVVISSAPEDPKRSPRVEKKWSQGMIDKYGKDNPWVMSSVYGRFPKTSINTLISPDQVREAMERELQPSAYNWCEKRLGTDVAFDGGDLTIHAPRQGLMWFDPEVTSVDRGRRDFSHQIAARIIKIKSSWKYDMDVIDATGGFGDGVISVLTSMDEKVVPYIGSGEPTNPMFANKVTECWWNMVESIKAGASLPDCPELIPELSKRTYTSDRYGRLMVQPKELYKKVLGRSPNYADEYGMTFMMPDRPAVDQLTKYLRDRSAASSRKSTNPLTRFKARYKSRVV